MKQHPWKTQELGDGWSLFLAPDDDLTPAQRSCRTRDELRGSGLLCVDACVPGNFELDLQRAGLLEDPFYAMNVLKLQKMEDRHLWYVCRFSVEAPANARLRFEGVDTFADVYLNGTQIGQTDNMLVEFDFPAEGLRAEENELVVHIRPAFLEARAYDAGINPTQSYRQDSLAVRKAPHMYGWDIMPRVLTGGIWKPVYLYWPPEESIDRLFVQTVSCTPERANLMAWYTVTAGHAQMDRYQLRLTGRCGERAFSCARALHHTAGYLSFWVEAPALWWPRNMGEPCLYEVKAELLLDGAVVDAYETQVGIRTVTLRRTSIMEEDGSGEFCFYVNGEPFFAMGTNWVPLDAFHARDIQRLPRALELLEDIGCSMVRCWGGNVYESDEFYEFCDRHGIAVWQDFSMACGVYPQDEPFCEALRREAEKVVLRLRQHPSLFLWAGDNECDESIAVSPLRQNPNQNKLTREVLPAVIKKLDPARPYLPSSPYMDEYAVSQNKIRSTTENHLWGPRDYYKGKFYTETACCFASETGYHGCPSPESIKRFLSPEALWPWRGNPEWLVHATCMDLDPNGPYAYRISLMARQIEVLFGREAESLEEFAALSQISQAEAFKFFIERFRIRKGRRTGILWWNLLDGWPQFSDAVVDYYFEKKLAYDVIKRSQQPVCLMMDEPCGGRLALVGVNEYRRELSVRYAVLDAESGRRIAQGQAVLPAAGSAVLEQIPCTGEGLSAYRIEWTPDGGEAAWNHYLCGDAPFDSERCVALLRRVGVLPGADA